MDQRKRIDKILEAVETRIQDEVATLLGSNFSVADGNRKIVTKAEAFERLPGKQICARFDITGDITGKGCLLIGIKDAIRLGGTLIMLPDQELQEVVGREEYREEVEDSYGEIANIITGSITKAFEEMYPKACRFVRKEQEILVPAKVAIDSDSPVANETFYLMSSAMLMDGRTMGDLVILFPAITFELVQDAVVPPPAPEVPVQENEAVKNTAPPSEATVEAGAAVAANQGRGAIHEQKPKVDREKQKKKVDRLLTECQNRLAGEVSALLGVDIMLDGIGNQIVSKEEFFSELTVGKQIMTDMEVAGELQDKCYFTLNIKDAINLGGILIMLPPSELVNVINEEDFSDDGQDAYGEVANIVSGVYTKVFEEQYQEKLRFIKKTLREVVPGKVVADSDEPIPNKAYYCHSMQLLVTGKQLGAIHMLFPAELLHLDSEPVEEVIQAGSAQTPVAPKVVQQLPRESENEVVASVSSPQKDKTIPSHAKAAADKQKKLVDKLLSSCRDKVANEVSALLGAEVQLGNQNNSVVSKEELFLEEISGKQVIAHMDVVGELEGKSYLMVNLRDAIRIGGVLIMLPSQELESVVSDEVFGEDTMDAYSEVANIIAGVYTAIFEEHYTKRIRFVKTDLQQVVPMKVAIDSDDPFPNGHYYFSSLDLTIGDSALGKVSIVFPLGLLELEGLIAAEEESSQVEETGQSATRQPASFDVANTALDILLIGDDESETAKIAAVFTRMDFAVKSLSFKDNVHNYIPGALKAIYLVMEDVNEQAFGAAIKISASCSLPLIAAGPGWTRTKVIKAVKYGIRDILLTPASKADIEENITNNLLKLAA
jgi:chemotaxis protein CheY-P-specific phosphatase CheC